MKRTALNLSVLAIGFVLAQAANAEPSVQDILNGITVGPTAGVSHAALVPEGSDGLWSIGGSGGSFQVLFTRNAGDANTFGLYDAANPANSVQVFSGTAAVGSTATVTMNGLGQVFVNSTLITTFAANRFGFFMNNNNGSGGSTFYSQTGLNADSYDHMWAYQGNGSDQIQLTPSSLIGTWSQNEFALFFEDTFGGGDGDHNDLGVFVESVGPAVPDGGLTIAFLGFALVSVQGLRRKFAK